MGASMAPNAEHSMKPSAPLFSATALLAACAFTTEPSLDRRIGIIESEYLHAHTLAAPDTVTRGQPFSLTVTTLGYNSCWQAAGVELARNGSHATVVPYDRVVGESCSEALVELPRTVELRFDTPGTATLILEGRRDSGEDQEVLVRIEHSIIVR